MSRWRLVAVRASKFGIIGGLCFVLDTGVFNALRLVAHGKPLTISIVATVISTIANYLGNRYFSFSDAGRPESRSRQLIAFFVVSVAAIAVSQVPLLISRYALGLDGPIADNVSRMFFGTAIGMILRFWGYHRFVFPHRDDAVREQTEEHAEAAGTVTTAALADAPPQAVPDAWIRSLAAEDEDPFHIGKPGRHASPHRARDDSNTGEIPLVGSPR